jgi:uncharacterized protein involved in exopolysaccharide biosynthesis
MNETPPSRSAWKPLATFSLLFSVVFCAVVVTATLITFILPESFEGTARIKVEPSATNSAALPSSQPAQGSYDPYLIPTETEVIQSELILGKVVEELELNTTWGQRYAGGAKLKTWESITRLKARLEARQIRNTSIIQIRVYSENPKDAAILANAITRIYVEHIRSDTNRVKAQIIESAFPAVRPSRPNKPLNIILGVIAGTLLGLGAGAAGMVFVYLRRGRGKKDVLPLGHRTDVVR